MKRLGLDISTSCTGWAVADVGDDGQVTGVEMGAIHLSKEPDLISKALRAQSVLQELQARHQF